MCTRTEAAAWTCAGLGLLQPLYWAEQRQQEDTHTLLLLATSYPPLPPPPISRTLINVTRDDDGAPGQGPLAEKNSPASCRQGHWTHTHCCPDVETNSFSTQRHSLTAGTPSMHYHASRKALPRRW